MERNMKQKDFAQKFGLDQATVSLVEGGHINPSLELIRAVVHEFNTSYTWLFDGDRQKETLKAAGNKQQKEFLKIFARNLRSLMRQEQMEELAFARRCAFTTERLQGFLQKKMLPGADELFNILQAFPEYNANWLLLDKGDSKIQREEREMEEIIRYNKELIALMQKSLPKKV